MNAIRWLANLLLPWGLLLLAAWAVQKEPVVHVAASPYAIYFCYAALVAALLLSWYQDQSRLLAIALAISLAVWGSRHLGPDAHLARLGIIFLLPLNFVLFQWLPERGALSLSGMLRLVTLGLQVPMIAWLSFAQPAVLQSLLRWGEPISNTAAIWFPLSETICFGVVLLILLALQFRRPTKVQQALPWALAAAFLAFNQATLPDSLFFYAGTAGLVLVVAVLEHGYDLATRDELTGLLGRRAFNRRLHQLSRQYAIAMCDVDNFKKFNDTHGHEGGDQVLKMVASMIAKVPGRSQAFRYGGEEFAIIFAGSSAKDAEPYLESLRSAVASHRFVLRGPNRPEKTPKQKPPTGERDSLTITISIGLAEHSKQHPTSQLVLAAADAALYRAKESGRNCVKLAAAASA
jgi:diguanylate cyclase (GGDEF)-like protein